MGAADKRMHGSARRFVNVVASSGVRTNAPLLVSLLSRRWHRFRCSTTGCPTKKKGAPDEGGEAAGDLQNLFFLSGLLASGYLGRGVRRLECRDDAHRGDLDTSHPLHLHRTLLAASHSFIRFFVSLNSLNVSIPFLRLYPDNASSGKVSGTTSWNDRVKFVIIEEGVDAKAQMPTNN
ncbi:hypothetical protein MRX96_055046 [Rhipicephalus microplus]